MVLLSRVGCSLAASLVSLLMALGLIGCREAFGNDEISPPAPAAAGAIDWKDGYFRIHGQPTLLLSGEMHYARIPRELWRDRIWRAKQMGFNCIQTYVFWNASEVAEGRWEFADNTDLDAWLSLLREMGMYAVVRVGPYSCAEWEHGGLPAWLTVKPGMTLRDSGPFEAYARRHLEKVERIVAKHQIHRDGSVVMVQLENEHPRGWGTDEGDPYLKRLVEQARANGLEVPLFLSGLHHFFDPSGETPYRIGTSPWFSTEFWTGWIGRYGDMPEGMLDEKIRGTWKIIAFGGAGYGYYMVHGGTNFGYCGDSFMTSYDYSAPIGEMGQFHNLYYPARRAAWFAQSFTGLLARSHNDPDLAGSDLPGLRVTTRTDLAGGSVIVVDNFRKSVDAKGLPPTPPNADAYAMPSVGPDGVVVTRLTVGGRVLPHIGGLKVSPVEPRTVIVNLPWTANASFDSICSNVFLRTRIGEVDYWVCYGEPGDTGELTLKFRNSEPSSRSISFVYPKDDSVQEIGVDSGDGQRAMLLVMNTARTNQTWLVGGRLCIGPAFVREDGGMEFPAGGGRVVIYAANGKSQVVQPDVVVSAPPVLSAWRWRDAAPERAIDYPSAKWTSSKGPQPMGSYDSFQNRYGWYRVTLHRDKAGPVSLRFSGSDAQWVAFANGKPVSLDGFEAQAGDNIIAILAKIPPRPKLFLAVGTMPDGVYRGLWGAVSTDKVPLIPTMTWKTWKSQGSPGKAEEVAQAGYDDSGWSTPEAGSDGKVRFDKGTTWFRGSFEMAAGQTNCFIQMPTVRWGESAAYFVNGHRLASPVADVSGFVVPGTNKVMVQIHGGPGAVELKLPLWRHDPLTQATWQFHGGLTGLDETAIVGRVTNWDAFLNATPWHDGEPSEPRLPAFWHATFTYHASAGIRQTLGLTTARKDRSGSVWLNGHNLGEYPQEHPLYLPECWLKEGANDLVIFDLHGVKPAEEKIAPCEVFSVDRSDGVPQAGGQ